MRTYGGRLGKSLPWLPAVPKGCIWVQPFRSMCPEASLVSSAVPALSSMSQRRFCLTWKGPWAAVQMTMGQSAALPPVLPRTCKLNQMSPPAPIRDHPKDPKSQGIQNLGGFPKINLEFMRFTSFFLSPHSDSVKRSSCECNRILPVPFS